MHKILAFSFIFISSFALAKVSQIPEELLKHIKDKKNERYELLQQYNREAEAAAVDFRSAGNVFGGAVIASVLGIRLIRLFDDSALMELKIGEYPLGAWALFALVVADVGALGYSGYKIYKGAGHLIQAKLKKSSLDMALKYE